MKRIKGYIKSSKNYVKILNNKKENGKILKILKKWIKNILPSFIKTFLILNLVNYIQLILLSNSVFLKVIKKLKTIKTDGLGPIFNILENQEYLVEKYIITILLFLVLYWIFYVITNKKRVSIILVIIITYTYSLANYIVTQIRGTALTIYDILSIQTAINVSENIKINIDTNIKIATFLFIVSIILSYVLYKNSKKMNIKTRIVSMFVLFSIIPIIANTQVIKKIYVWDMNTAYNQHGIVLTLFKLSMNISYSKPESYKKENIETLLTDYETNENDNYNSDTNIIVIMNESFADYTQNHNVNVLQDNIPYFHSLQDEENTITGIMHSDSYGGGTSNVEYSFLTSNSTAFMPSGAIPFLQYIRKPIPSIATRTKKLGYTTYAIHLWNKSGYNRENVYRLLQFDSYKFREDYNDLTYSVNGYTTDESSYSKIREVFENKNESEKVFMFNITMENHLPYKKQDEKQIRYADDNTLNIYLQMQNNSDEALKKLIQYLKEYNEKVVLLFFGDHQPMLNIEELNKDYDNKKKVPYLIWANYDIEEKEYGDTSAIYLYSILAEIANLPKDRYINYLTELRKEIPVITASYYIGSDGKRYNDFKDTTSPYYEKIREFENVSYYQLMDVSE